MQIYYDLLIVVFLWVFLTHLKINVFKLHVKPRVCIAHVGYLSYSHDILISAIFYFVHLDYVLLCVCTVCIT